MKREFFRIIFELLIVGILMGISIPAWEAHAQRMPSSHEAFLMSGKGLVISTEDNNNYTIRNISNQKTSGQLVINYKKDSSIHYDNVDIVYNGIVLDKKELAIDEGDYYYVFTIDNLNVAKYSNLEMTLSVRINSEYRSDAKSSFSYKVNLIY